MIHLNSTLKKSSNLTGENVSQFTQVRVHFLPFLLSHSWISLFLFSFLFLYSSLLISYFIIKFSLPFLVFIIVSHCYFISRSPSPLLSLYITLPLPLNPSFFHSLFLCECKSSFIYRFC